MRDRTLAGAQQSSVLVLKEWSYRTKMTVGDRQKPPNRTNGGVAEAA